MIGNISLIWLANCQIDVSVFSAFTYNVRFRSLVINPFFNVTLNSLCWGQQKNASPISALAGIAMFRNELEWVAVLKLKCIILLHPTFYYYAALPSLLYHDKAKPSTRLPIILISISSVDKHNIYNIIINITSPSTTLRPTTCPTKMPRTNSSFSFLYLHVNPCGMNSIQ